MKTGYTEFSYGYAFTENLISSQVSPPINAPYFPNLQQEATLGYDIRIDLPTSPIFFQFKIPERMVRTTAAEISKYALPGISIPFFRMPLMESRFSSQHDHLLTLEASNPARVYYCCSTAPDLRRFNADYLDKQVHNHSLIVPPSFIGPLPDHKKHNVVFTGISGPLYFCSEPREVERRQLKEAISFLFDPPREDALGEEVKVRSEKIDDVIDKALTDLLAIIGDRHMALDEWLTRVQTRLAATQEFAPRIDFPEQLRVKIIAAREIARSMLGLEFLIAQNYAQESNP